jgi:hypothetical protein
VFENSSIPVWTAIATFAAVGQVVILMVTARFVWCGTGVELTQLVIECNRKRRSL